MEKLRHFFAEEYDNLVNRANRRVRNIDDAEDCVMDAFRKAVEYWNSYNSERQEIGAWYNTILNNSIKTFQREKFMKHIEADNEAEIPFEHSYENEELYRKLLEEIEFVESKTRKNVLHLFFVLNYSPLAIEQVLAVPKRNVRYFVSEFKNDMRGKYGEEYEDMYW